MRTIKLILALLFVMMVSSAFAQQVIVHKTDGTETLFISNDVDSIAFVPESDKAIAYYGWVSEEDVYNITNFTAQYFPNEITNVLLTIEGENLKNGQCMVVATKGNVMGFQNQNDVQLMYGFMSGENWEVNNTVEINGETYFVWIRSVAISSLVQKIILMLDE